MLHHRKNRDCITKQISGTGGNSAAIIMCTTCLQCDSTWIRLPREFDFDVALSQVQMRLGEEVGWNMFTIGNKSAWGATKLTAASMKEARKRMLR